MLTELINFHCLCYPGDRDGSRKDFPWCCHIELSTCNDDCLCEMQKPTQMQIISNKRNMDFNYNIHCVGSCASDLVTYQERLFCSYLNSAKKKKQKNEQKTNTVTEEVMGKSLLSRTQQTIKFLEEVIEARQKGRKLQGNKRERTPSLQSLVEASRPLRIESSKTAFAEGLS